MLNKLEEFKSEGEKNWVKSPKGLGDVLRRLKPAFRQIEISIEIDPKQKRDGIHVHINGLKIALMKNVNLVNIVNLFRRKIIHTRTSRNSEPLLFSGLRIKNAKTKFTKFTKLTHGSTRTFK